MNAYFGQMLPDYARKHLSAAASMTRGSAFYNEYALAAYVYGSFHFIIPYESLEDLLIS